MYISNEIKHKINKYKAKGGKTNRERVIYRINTFLNFCKKNGKTTPHEIGKKDVYQFFNKNKNLKNTTKRDYYYAIRALWLHVLNRPNDPPYPFF